MRVVKGKEERKQEIREAGKAVFLEKGFEKTTMEDIVAETSLSKGGVYYYYSSTTEILYDLMIEGSAYRYKIIKKFMEKQTREWDRELLAEQLVEKMLDKSDYMSLYVVYLQATQTNGQLRELYQDLKAANLKMMEACLGGGHDPLIKVLFGDFFISFMNAIILASEILNAREIFRSHRDLILSMVQVALDQAT